MPLHRHAAVVRPQTAVSTPSAHILPSLASSRRLGASASTNCWHHRRCKPRAGARAHPGVCRCSWRPMGTLKAQILQFDRLIMAWHRSNQASRRLDDIPGVGPVLATALVATVADARRSDQDVISQSGSGWFRRNTRAGARTGSAVSANEASAICASYLWPVHWPSSAMPRSMAPSTGPGSRHCWRATDRQVANAVALGVTADMSPERPERCF